MSFDRKGIIMKFSGWEADGPDIDLPIFICRALFFYPSLKCNNSIVPPGQMWPGQLSSLPQSVNQFDTICPVTGFCFRNIYLYLYVYREIDLSAPNWQIQRWSWQGVQQWSATLLALFVRHFCALFVILSGSIISLRSFWNPPLFVGYREKIEELEWKNKSLLSESLPTGLPSA